MIAFVASRMEYDMVHQRGLFQLLTLIEIDTHALMLDNTGLWQ
jgi:hypothetical protein